MDIKTLKFEDGLVISESTYLGKRFESTETLPDKERKEELERTRGLYTLNVRFNFDDVGVMEVVTQACTTTSLMKMLQNNRLKHWADERSADFKDAGALEAICSEPYEVSVRELFDEKRTNAVSDEEKLARKVRELKAKGKTKAEILDILDLEFED